MLRPITTTHLRGEEWSNLDPIDLQLGGSCYWLGRYLNDIYSESSHLYTLIGDAQDPLTLEAERLIELEPWILNPLPHAGRNEQTAVSVHLIQRSNEYTTVFTHRGALAEFSWQDVSNENAPAINGQSIFHISGFMKTNLASGLVNFLRTIHTENVVVFDHGGMVPNIEYPTAIHAIREAYEQGLMDIYLCTYEDFRHFCRFPHVEQAYSNQGAIKKQLTTLARALPLPCVTIVRGHLPDLTKAYIIMAGDVTEVSLDRSESIRKGYFFSKQIFDAGFLHWLAHNDAGRPLRQRIISAVNEGLSLWSRNSHNSTEPSRSRHGSS
jgi:hypothetical protein